MSISYNPNPTQYSPKLPPKLSSADYLKYSNSLPFYPSPTSPLKTLWKQETGSFVFLIIGCVFWPVLPIVIIAFAINGGFGSFNNCYKAAKEQNQVVKRYYDLIYHTSSYEDYCVKFDKELGYYVNNRNFY